MLRKNCFRDLTIYRTSSSDTLPINRYRRSQIAVSYCGAFLSPGMVPVADGLNQLTYNIVLVKADGSPMTRFRGTATFSTGDKGKIKEKSNGTYAITVTPNAINSIQDVDLTLSGKGRGEKIQQTWKIEMASSSSR